MAAAPQATVLITTKDRRDELRVAVASALAQDAAVEVLVVDDGSSDGTSAMLAEAFPAVRVIRDDVSRGLIVQRNRGAREARAPVVFSLDDDAEYTAPDTVSATLREFSHPRVGAVAMPHVDVNQGPAVKTRAPDGAAIWVTSSYIGTAHALRRDVFLALGGYRESLVYRAEEADLCLRMLAAGFVTRLGAAAPIHHHESPRRDSRAMVLYGRRNDILFAWHNTPMPYAVGRLAKVTADSARMAARSGRARDVWDGVVAGYRDGFRDRGARRPVPRRVYALSRSLRLRGPARLEDVEAALPPLR